MADEIEQNAQLARLREEIVRLTLLEAARQADGETSAVLNHTLSKAINASFSGELTRNEQTIKSELGALKDVLLAEIRAASERPGSAPFLSSYEISRIARELAGQLNGTLLGPQELQQPQMTDREVGAVPQPEPATPVDVQDQDEDQDQDQGDEPTKPANGAKFFALEWNRLRLGIIFLLGLVMGALLHFATTGRIDNTDAGPVVSDNSQETLVELIESTAVLDNWIRKAAVNTQLDAKRPVGQGIQADTRINLSNNLGEVLQLVDKLGLAQDPAIASQVRDLDSFRAALMGVAIDQVSPKTWTPAVMILAVADINGAARRKLGLPQSAAPEEEETASPPPAVTSTRRDTPTSAPSTDATPAPTPAVRG